MSTRRIAVLVSVGAAIVLAVASSASACFVAGTSPNASVAPHQAEAGDQVTMTGGNWVAGTSPVAVRWASTSGQLLARAYPNPDTRGGFSVAITIPENATPGQQLLYVTQDGSKETPVIFDVVKPATITPGTPDPGPAQVNTSLATGGGRSPEPAAEVASGVAPVLAPVGPLAQETTQPVSSSPTPVRVGSAVPKGTSLQPLLPTRRAQAAGATQSPATQSPATESPATEAPLTPSLRSGSADVWSGLANGRNRTASPSLADLSTAPSSGGTDAGTVAALVLISGLIALAGGFALAESGRRKSTVTAQRRS